MMNFGKSRAKMSTDADKKVTFKEVAGLQEEKEELEGNCGLFEGAAKICKGGSQNSKGCAFGRSSWYR